MIFMLDVSCAMIWLFHMLYELYCHYRRHSVSLHSQACLGLIVKCCISMVARLLIRRGTTKISI